MSNYPNIFNYATKELSQDAFFTWLINWASSEFIGNALHDCAVDFINQMIPNGEKIEVESVKTWQQWKHIDIWASINNKVAIIIEDKIDNSIEGMNKSKDQLDSYEEETKKWCIENSYKCFFIFLKTGFITPKEKRYMVERHGSWRILDRHDVLTLLNKYRGKISNDIFQDYLSRINDIESEIQSFKTVKVENWTYYSIQGFVEEIVKRINVVDAKWENNKSGGFFGICWHWVECRNKKYSYYLQLELNDYSADINNKFKLCLRIELYSDDAETRRKDRDSAIKFLDENLSETDLSIIKKAVLSKQIVYCMTIKHISQDAWLIKDQNGFLDLDKTLVRLKQIGCILDKLK